MTHFATFLNYESCGIVTPIETNSGLQKLATGCVLPEKLAHPNKATTWEQVSADVAFCHTYFQMAENNQLLKKGGPK